MFNWEIVRSGAGAPRWGRKSPQSQPGFAPGLAMAITFGRRRSSSRFGLRRRGAAGTQVVWRNRVRLRCCGDEFLGNDRPLRCIAGSVAMSICVLVAPRTPRTVCGGPAHAIGNGSMGAASSHAVRMPGLAHAVGRQRSLARLPAGETQAQSCRRTDRGWPMRATAAKRSPFGAPGASRSRVFPLTLKAGRWRAAPPDGPIGSLDSRAKRHPQMQCQP
jgi:hypothetical protein